MSEESVEVDAKRFEELCQHYSGDLLGKNTCKAVTFANRLWTVTGIVSGGKLVPTVQLHELVLPDRYKGPTGSYPFDTDGVFYKGQAVKARGRAFVMSGRELLVVRTNDAPESQLDLLGWQEATQTAATKERKAKTVRKKTKKSKPDLKRNGAARPKQRAKTPQKIKRR